MTDNQNETIHKQVSFEDQINSLESDGFCPFVDSGFRMAQTQSRYIAKQADQQLKAAHDRIAELERQNDQLKVCHDDVLMPRSLTTENGAKYHFIGEFSVTAESIDEDGEIYINTIPIPWSTIKDIYKKAVEIFDPSSAPNQTNP